MKSKRCLLDGEPVLTSLCPALGERYSVVRHGMCPSNLLNVFGKELPIAVIGGFPYVIYNEAKEWVGGTEFQLLDLYVEKFGFIPKLMRAAGYEGEGSVIDMVRKIHLIITIPLLLLSHAGQQKGL